MFTNVAAVDNARPCARECAAPDLNEANLAVSPTRYTQFPWRRNSDSDTTTITNFNRLYE